MECVKAPANFVAGGFEDIEYKNYLTQIEPGESIVLYTDGVTEAFNDKKELFGEQRLENSLLELYYEDARTIVEEVHSDLKEFTGDTPQSDDITMLVVKRIKEE